MTIRAILFDFGGVLVRTVDQSGRARWEKRFGLPPGGAAALVFESAAARRATLGAGPKEAIWQHVADVLGLDAVGLSEFKADFWSGDRLDTELVEFMRQLRPRVKTSILSNAWPGNARMMAENFGLSSVVDDILVSADVGFAKPDARIFQLALDRLGVAPHEAVFVDDFVVNVDGAAAVGIHAVHFRNTLQAIADVNDLLAIP